MCTCPTVGFHGGCVEEIKNRLGINSGKKLAFEYFPAIRDENINRKVVKMTQQVKALAAKPEVDPWDIHGGGTH